MKSITTALFLILALMLSSCDMVKYNSTHQPLAKYYSFSTDTSKRELPILDTTHIYILGQDLVRTYRSGNIEKCYLYTFFKFSSTGLAFYSTATEEKPDSSTIYTNPGQYCFYKVVGNEIRLEFYDYHLKRFTIAYLNVYPDKLILYKDKLRVWWGGKSKYNNAYIKSDIAYIRQLQFPE